MCVTFVCIIFAALSTIMYGAMTAANWEVTGISLGGKCRQMTHEMKKEYHCCIGCLVILCAVLATLRSSTVRIWKGKTEEKNDFGLVCVLH